MAQTILFNIEGMTCDHCVHAVTLALKDVPGVRDAKVSLADKSAVVEGDGVEVQKALAAVADEGYTASVR
jgi:copper chaperone CopZ